MRTISQTPLPLVDIVVITFNGIRHVEGCFRALERTNYPNYQVILLDNGSTDGSGDLVANRFPYCRIIRTGKNLGFAGGNNVAMRRSLEGQAEFIVLINDDAYICDPEWLSRAVAVATADPLIGMVGFEVTQGSGVYDESSNQARTESVVQAQATNLIEGCSLFIRSDVLRRIGLFDEIYFMYAEEDDLEVRAKLAGFSLVRINSAIFHIGGSTSRKYPIRIAYYQARNYLRFALKNLGALRALGRIVALCDILCNPFPLLYRSSDRAHVRMRSTGSLLLNCGIYGLALSWNLIHLPQTLLLRLRRKRVAYC
jgi:GT2 family glycosyltransferase